MPRYREALELLLDEGVLYVKHYGKPLEWLDQAPDLPGRDNVLPVVLGLVGIGVVVCAMWASGPGEGGGPGERLAPCILVADDHARLTCYDQIAVPHPPAKGAFAPAQTHREGSQ
jgi:hypothetical protein